MKQHNQSDADATKEGTKEQFLAFSVLTGCDRKQCGGMSENLENYFTFDECPNTQQKAHDY